MKNELETAKELGFEDIPTRKELYEEIERLNNEFDKLNHEEGKAIKDLQSEIKDLNARLNPKTLYGIETGKVEKLVNVKVEYHFDIKSSALGGWIEADEIGKYAFLTEQEAEKALKEKGNESN